MVTAPDEVRTQRVWVELGIDGERRRPQGLGHDLAAEQPTPRVAGPDTDEGVRSVVGEVEQGSEIHGGPTLAADRHDPNSRT